RAGIAFDHPVRERQTYAAALAESRHDRAGRPEVCQALDRTYQRISVRGESERSVDDLLDSRPFDGGKMTEADFQRRRDAIEIRRQQLVAEVPGGRNRRPGSACFLVGAKKDAVAFLARVD